MALTAVVAASLTFSGCGVVRPLQRLTAPGWLTGASAIGDYSLTRTFQTGYEPGALAVSREGNLIAVAGRTSPYIDIFDATTGAHRERLLGHRLPPIGALEFSADGRLLVSGGGEQEAGTPEPSVRLWAPVAGKILRTIPMAQTGVIHSVAVSADGRSIASASSDSLRVWSVDRTVQPLGLWVDHASAVCGMAVSPDFKLIATAGWDFRILVRAISAMNRFEALLGHESAPCGLAFHPEGTRLMSWEIGADRAMVRLWDVERFVPLAHMNFRGRVFTAFFTEAGPVVVVRGAGGERNGNAEYPSNALSLVSLTDRRVVAILPVNPKLVQASVAGDMVVAATFDGSVSVFRRGGVR